MKKNKLITWGLFFLAFFLIMQYFNKKQAPTPVSPGASVDVSMTKTQYAVGGDIAIKITNNTQNPITIKSNCPKNPFKVLMFKEDKFEEVTAETKLDCAQFAPDVVIESGRDAAINYTYWNHALFGTAGKYKIEAEIAAASGTTTYAAPEFTVAEAGFWKKFFRKIFYQPIYNVLIFLIKAAPKYDLGFAIILLTIFIRLILLAPSQRAIAAQRRMQELQPKLDAIKKKYAGNQERIAQETMRLWKENKVSPFGSCLPTLIQFPIVIALFYVIRDGLNPDNSYLLYGPLQNFDVSKVHTNFLGILELMRINTFALPLIVGALQFFQIKLSMMPKKKQTEDEGKPQPKSEMEAVNKSMTYIMPIMIALFTVSVPAGVGLYWGVSTLFAIGQQLIANRKVA